MVELVINKMLSMKISLSRYSLYIILLFTFAFFAGACKKSGTAGSDSFTWTYGSTNYTANIKGAYTQSLSTSPIIIAGTGTSLQSAGTGPRITVPSFNVGTYTLSSTVYTIYYTDAQGNSLGITSGSLTITNNSNSQISGNFSATLTNAVSLSGSFTALQVSQ